MAYGQFALKVQGARGITPFTGPLSPDSGPKAELHASLLKRGASSSSLGDQLPPAILDLEASHQLTMLLPDTDITDIMLMIVMCPQGL